MHPTLNLSTSDDGVVIPISTFGINIKHQELVSRLDVPSSILGKEINTDQREAIATGEWFILDKDSVRKNKDTIVLVPKNTSRVIPDSIATTTLDAKQITSLEQGKTIGVTINSEVKFFEWNKETNFLQQKSEKEVGIPTKIEDYILTNQDKIDLLATGKLENIPINTPDKLIYLDVSLKDGILQATTTPIGKINDLLQDVIYKKQTEKLKKIVLDNPSLVDKKLIRSILSNTKLSNEDKKEILLATGDKGVELFKNMQAEDKNQIQAKKEQSQNTVKAMSTIDNVSKNITNLFH